MIKSNKSIAVNFFTVAAVSFLSAFFGLKFAAGSQLSGRNLFFLLGFCILLGFISSIFYQFRLKTAWIIFNIGIAVGLIDMFYVFFSNLSGWEDLAALASLFVWIVAGLIGGIVIQFAISLYQKFKKK